MVFFERTPSTKSEFYFELDNGQVCILSEDGAYFFSRLSSSVRKAVLFGPSAILLTIYTSFLNIYNIALFSNPIFSFGFAFLALVVPFVPGKILAMGGRTNKFSGRSLEAILNSSDEKFLRSRRDWTEVRTANLRHYRVILRWNTSTFLTDRGVTMKFVGQQYSELRAFLVEKLGGKLVEKP